MNATTEQRTIQKVSGFMRPDPPAVDFEGTLGDALSVMVERDRSSILVMEGGNVVGVIGADDIGRLVAKGVDLQKSRVRDFVAACLLTGNQPCVQIRNDDTVLHALQVMDSWTASQIIVVDEENRVVGTLTVLDALKGWMKEVYAP